VVVSVEVIVLPGAVEVTVAPGAVEVTVAPGPVDVTVVPGAVEVSVMVQVALVEGFAAYTATAPTTNPPTAAAPIFKNVLLEASEVVLAVSVITPL
jgi:hypothetical protein